MEAFVITVLVCLVICNIYVAIKLLRNPKIDDKALLIKLLEDSRIERINEIEVICEILN